MTGEASPLSTGPLNGIKVLDLSRVLAGPWATQFLGDLGADVIKVERPGNGDDTRSWGPPYVQSSSDPANYASAYFLGTNRGKRSITVDIHHTEGQDLIRQLAADADVLIENFKYGTLERLGLSYLDLKQVNPRLIYCSITGFGQTGPRRAQPAYDFAVQALGGLMSITGEHDDMPGGGPQKVGIPIIDLTTGVYAAAGIMAALVKRESTGGGEFIDVSMLDVQVSLLSNQAMNYLIGDQVPVRTGNRHPNIQPQDKFECKDGAIVIAVGNDAQYERFARALEIDIDPRFSSNAERVANEEALRAIIAQRLSQHPRAHWVTLLEAAGVPCAPINSIDEVFADEQVREREMVVEVDYEDFGTVRHVRSPLRFTESVLEQAKPAPNVGQHTESVLESLGIPADTITALRKAGVV